MISKEFIKSSVIYTLAGALPMASAFILLPFYLALPREVYGALALYLAFSLFIQILVAYSFDTSLYVHFHEYKNDRLKLGAFISSAFVFMLFIGCAIGLPVIVGGELLFKWIFEDKHVSFYPFGLLAFVTGIFQALFKVYTNLLQSREKPALFLRSNLFLFSLIASLTIVGLYLFPDSLAGPIGGRAIAGFLTSAWVLFRIFREHGVHFDFSLLKSTFHFNHYSFIYQIQQWFINYSDRFIILFAGLSAASNTSSTLGSIGVYDFALKCLVLVELIMNGLNSSFYPKVVSTVMAQSTKTTTPELNRYYHGLISMVMLMVAGAILVLPYAVYIFDMSEGYDQAIPYFPFIAVIFILKSVRIYFAFPYAVLKYTKPLPVIYAFVTLFKIGLMILLVRDYGIYGLVAASLISLSTELVILYSGLMNRFIFSFNIFKILVAPFILLIAVLIFEPLFGRMHPLLTHGGYVILTFSFLMWTYRNELSTLSFGKWLVKPK